MYTMHRTTGHNTFYWPWQAPINKCINIHITTVIHTNKIKLLFM